MDKHRGKAAVLIICMLFIFVFVSGAERQEKPEQKQEEEEKASIFQVVKSLFTVSTSSPISGRSYWEKVKTAINRVQAHFFPPNLEYSSVKFTFLLLTYVSENGMIKYSFRVKDEAGDGGEKVKGAVAKSIEKSKATLEGSAKSAAEIAGKTVQKTKDKVKKSFSQSEL
ncbi:uncharacterized protein LOC116130579 [Pistacia vera]|uniref:uncharacterized protein LOC116130579 n=1 Tax=Pistacia vera TaxID=55513 RepID=UPI0012635CE3|nr:uncharacterized protein LOC116130579 [Pistacia vera]